MTAYKDRSVVTFTHTKHFASDAVRESMITLGSHSGTHIDAPSHFMQDGISIHEMALVRTCGRARVLDCTHMQHAITESDLRQHDIEADDIILLKTRNSNRPWNASFDYEFVYLEQSGAAYLATQGVKAVGIDYLGIERNQPKHESHLLLMNAGIPIIEGLRLAEVEPQVYILWCLPLAIQGLEAAPARALLQIIT